jgi:hypothetical protein
MKQGGQAMMLMAIQVVESYRRPILLMLFLVAVDAVVVVVVVG